MKKLSTIANRIWKGVDRLTSPVVAYRAHSLWNQMQTLAYNVRYRIQPVASAILLANIAVQWSVAVLCTPICAVARLIGVHFLMVDLTQIGSVMWVDIYLRDMKLRLKQPRTILICRSRFTDANSYMLDLYRPHVVYVFNPLLKLLMIPFFVNPWFRDDAFRYDPPFVHGKKFGEQGSFGYGVVTAHNERFGGPIARLPEADLRRGRDLMAPMLEPGTPFVAVHVRDSGFYRDTHRTTRNADIRTYEPAFRYLIDCGYAVVRTGDRNMVRIDEMIERCGPKLIDYAHSDVKCDFLDIYLVAACRLFIGSTSGPLALPIALNVPSCFVNFYNASTCLGYQFGDLTTFKKIRRLSDDSLVPFEDLMQPPLSENPQHKHLELGGFYLEDNSPEEILASVREYFERGDNWPSARQRFAKSLVPKARHSYEAAGDFSETILKLYFPDFQAHESNSAGSLSGSASASARAPGVPAGMNQ